MRNRQFEKFISNSLQVETQANRMDETISTCVNIMRKQAVVCEEERTGFWQFLSDVLRFEGLGILGFQVLTLCIVCLGIQTIADAPTNIPIFMPLFVLAVLPSMFKGVSHGMCELEAATRASNAQIVLAKLILAGGANLICMTALLGVEVCLYHSTESTGRLVLYTIVPYLVCMVVVLRCIMLRGKDGHTISVVSIITSSTAWWICARTIPQLYEVSATGVWIVAFFIFAAIFLREILYIFESKKEGKMYGIIA